MTNNEFEAMSPAEHRLAKEVIFAKADNRTRYHDATEPLINASTRKVGGIRFFKLGRFCFAFCITRRYTPL